MPGTLVEIGDNSPRTFAGASGLGSQESCCGTPPVRNSITQRFARPNDSRCSAARELAKAVNNSGKDKPVHPSVPAVSHLRRDQSAKLVLTADIKTSSGRMP
jgi:hypothetical protein